MRRKPWWKQRNSLLLTITLIVALVLFVVDLFGGFVPLELLVYDRFWSRRAIHQWDERVVIVGFDNKDEQDYGEHPTDELLRQVLDKVNRGNPTTVGLMYTRHAKPQNPSQREGLERQMVIMADKLVRSTFDDKYIEEPDNVIRRLALYRNNSYYGIRISSNLPIERWITWAIAYHYLKAQGAKIEEPIKAYGNLSITYPTGERVSFLPLSPSQDGGYHASTQDLERYQVLLSFPQERLQRFFSFGDILNQPPVDFEGKIVIIGGLAKTNKTFVRTPIYGRKKTYAYLYDSEFIGLGVSNFLQLPQAPFVAILREGTEFLYLLGWLLFSSLLVGLLSFDLRKKYAWLIFLFGVIVAWLFVILVIFIVSFSVFPKLWIPCGWIWLGTSANIVIGAFATLELAYQDEQEKVLIEQKKVLAEQKKVSIEQKKALAEKTKRLKQEENYNQRLNQEIETLKNTLLAQERLAFIGKLAPFIHHRTLNLYDRINFHISLLKKNSNIIDQNVSEIDINMTEEEQETYKSKIFNALNKIEESGDEQRHIIKECGNLLERFLPILRHDQETRLTPKWFDFESILKESIKANNHNYFNNKEKLKIDVKVDIEDSLPEIYGFPSELEFALINIIENAYYAVWEKAQNNQQNYQPTIIIEAKSRDFQKIIVKIMDNGIGISADVGEQVFSPFYSTRQKFHQAGIGLTLTKDIIEQNYQGRIYYQILDTMTCFIIELNYLELREET